MTAPPKNYLLLVQTTKINYDPKYKTPYYIRHIKLTYFISRDAAINTMRFPWQFSVYVVVEMFIFEGVNFRTFYVSCCLSYQRC